MGTMEKMRQTSPYLLALFAIVFVGFMVASDADVSNLMSQGDNYQTAPIAEINGDEILYRDFEIRVNEVIEQQRQQMQQQGIEQDIDEMAVRRQVWNEMLEEKILQKQSKEMGIYVTDGEILDIMLNNPPDFLRKPFTDSLGNFQKESYVEIMTKPDVIYQRLPEQMSQEEKKKIVDDFRNDIIKIEKTLREEKLRTGVNNAVNTSLSFVSPLFAKEKFRADNSSAEVNFIYLDSKTVDDTKIKVSSGEISEYYNKYKHLWPQKQRRKIKYVALPLVPSSGDTAAVLKSVAKTDKAIKEAATPEEAVNVFTRMMGAYKGETIDFTPAKDIPQNLMPYLSELTVGGIVGPLQLQDGTYFLRLDDKRSGENFVVKAAHILVSFGNNKDSAKAEAERIKKEAGTGNFSQLAIQYSADQGSARNGGDLGYFGKGQMVPEFEKAAFEASSGSVVGPVETQFGWHIIKVLDKQSDEMKYSQIVMTPKMTRITQKAIGRNAKEIKSRLVDGENFDAISKEFGITARESEYFEQTKPILGSNYISAKAFELNAGEIIEPVELKNVGIFIGQLTDIQQAGVVPLEEMKNKIEVILLQEKRVASLKAKAEKVYNEVKGLSSLMDYVTTDPGVQLQSAAGVKDNGVVPGIGQDATFTTTAFKLPINQISKPVKGDQAYYIIQVVNRQVPNEQDIKPLMNEYMTQLKNNFKSAGYYQWFQKLREDADIIDYRTKFFTEF